MLEEQKRNDNETNDTNQSNMEEENDVEPQKISQSTANKLRQEALTFKKYWEDYENNSTTDTSEVLYLISTKWLNRWKKNISYEEMINGHQPTNFFGRPITEKINEDLMAQGIEPCFKYIPLKENPWNIYLRDDIEEKKDYEIVNKKINDFFHSSYDGKVINRNVIGEGAERYTEVNLLRFQTVLLYPGLITNLSNNYSSKSTPTTQEYLQVARSFSVQEYYTLLEKTLQTFRGSWQKEKGVRIWKSPPQDNPSKALFSMIKRQTIDLEYHEDVVFDYDGELIDETKYQTIEEIGISPNDLIIIEFKESSKPWTIKNAQVSAEGKCEGCYNIRVLQFPCICKKVAYCSEKCKVGDEKYHSSRCEKSASDDETVQETLANDQSVFGVCGLSNLGNTCFMNSGLQCLANTMILSEFFLSNKYFSQINEDNPLGSKGVLVRKYGSLLKKLFYGSKNTVSPSALKIAIGKFQPMFKGYHQHDSSELITFLLDGLHEDLNLIKVKPYVESKDSEDRPDFEVAKEAWEGFTKRNQSIIVDTMYGQYKSKLQCPTCQKISITFDPFLMVSLTVPSNKRKLLNYSTQKDLLRTQKKQEFFEKNSTQTVQEFLNKIQRESFEDKESIMFLMCTYQSFEHINGTMSLAEARKKAKRMGLGVRVLSTLESSVEVDKRLYLPIQNKSVEGYGYKRSLYQNNLIVLSKDLTLEECHLKIFELLSFLFKHLMEGKPLTKELFESDFQDKYFTIEMKSNGSFWQGCAYCGKKNCNDCKLPYTAENLGDYVEAAEKSDNQLHFELILVWTQTPYEKTKISDIFDHYIKSQLMSEENDDEKNNSDIKFTKENSNNTSVSLNDCLNYSQQPEQLEADNTWYCRNCQNHVRAYKSMQIYKAPKILMFHLKRFKASNRMFKQKLETLVDFPLNGLDLSEYIINSNIPGAYNHEDMSNNGENKEHKQVVYDLYAVSNHFGGLGGGHYTAFAKNQKDQQWYNFDDSHVSPVGPSDSVVSKAAYVLFYKQREAEDEKNFNNIDK